MVFWENFEYQVDTKESELSSVEKQTMLEMNNLKASVIFQDKGEAEKLPDTQIQNIVTFCEEYLDEEDSFVVRARADGFWLSKEGSAQKKEKALQLSAKLQQKWLSITPDISTGNTAQAWIRALTLLDQLPQNTLNLVKNKLAFDVQSVLEKDEQGTYRLASFDIKRWTEYLPDIQRWQYEEPIDIDQPFIEDPFLEENTYEETNLPDKEKKIFSSWEALQKPLSVPLVAKIGKQYYIKYTFYKRENWKLLTTSRGWQKTSKERFNDRISKKWLKVNSISLDLSKEFSKYEKEISKLPKLGKRLSYLNMLVEWNPRYALNKLYENQLQRKWTDKYVARAKENEIQNNQNQSNKKLLASSN